MGNGNVKSAKVQPSLKPIDQSISRSVNQVDSAEPRTSIPSLSQINKQSINQSNKQSISKSAPQFPTITDNVPSPLLLPSLAKPIKPIVNPPFEANNQSSNSLSIKQSINQKSSLSSDQSINQSYQPSNSLSTPSASPDTQSNNRSINNNTLDPPQPRLSLSVTPPTVINQSDSQQDPTTDNQSNNQTISQSIVHSITLPNQAVELGSKTADQTAPKLAISSTFNQTIDRSISQTISSPSAWSVDDNNHRSLICRFCGGPGCKHEDYTKQKDRSNAPIIGLHSNWVTQTINPSIKMIGMQRPSTELIQTHKIASQFNDLNIHAVINCQLPGEHRHCGPGIHNGGFSYHASDLPNINVYHFGWVDMAVPTIQHMVNICCVVQYHQSNNQSVAVHCHAGFGRTGLVIACYFVFEQSINLSSNQAIKIVRECRPGSLQTKEQIKFVHRFEMYIRSIRAQFIDVANIEHIKQTINQSTIQTNNQLNSLSHTFCSPNIHGNNQTFSSTRAINRTISQSVKGSIHQTTILSTRSINTSNNESNDQSINQSINQKLHHTTSLFPQLQIQRTKSEQPNHQPMNQTINQSISQSINQTINQTVNQQSSLTPRLWTPRSPISKNNLSVSQSLTRSVTQTSSQSNSPSTNQTDESSNQFPLHPYSLTDILRHQQTFLHGHDRIQSINQSKTINQLIQSIHQQEDQLIDCFLKRVKINQTINQSIKQSVNQSINQTVTPSVDPSVTQSIDMLVDDLGINQSISLPFDFLSCWDSIDDESIYQIKCRINNDDYRWIKQSNDQSINQTNNKSIEYTPLHTFICLIDWCAGLREPLIAIDQSINHSINQVIQSINPFYLETINQIINLAIRLICEASVNQSIDQSVAKVPVSSLIKLAMGYALIQINNQSISQLINPALIFHPHQHFRCQLNNQSINQSDSQSYDHEIHDLVDALIDHWPSIYQSIKEQQLINRLSETVGVRPDQDKWWIQTPSHNQSNNQSNNQLNQSINLSDQLVVQPVDQTDNGSIALSEDQLIKAKIEDAIEQTNSQSADQSTTQSNNQSNQVVIQSLDLSIAQPVRQSSAPPEIIDINHSLDQTNSTFEAMDLITQTIYQTNRQSINQSVDQSDAQEVYQPNDQTKNEEECKYDTETSLVIETARPSISLSNNQFLNQSMDRSPINMSNRRSINQSLNQPNNQMLGRPSLPPLKLVGSPRRG